MAKGGGGWKEGVLSVRGGGRGFVASRERPREWPSAPTAQQPHGHAASVQPSSSSDAPPLQNQGPPGAQETEPASLLHTALGRELWSP